MLSRTDPSAYSKIRARSRPELREYPSARFAVMEPTALYSWAATFSATGSRRRWSQSVQASSATSLANWYARILERGSSFGLYGGIEWGTAKGGHQNRRVHPQSSRRQI